jgi:hypothetical protein
MIRHIVALRFPEDAPAALKAAHYAALAGLRGHLDGVLDFRSFENVSPETALVRGFRDGFWFDFRDVAARDAYLADPEHGRVGARLVEALEGGAEGVFVLDVAL